MSWGVLDYPDEPPESRPVPVCPVCGEECDEVYLNLNGEVVFCDNCIDKELWKRDAYEWWEDEHAI